MSQNSTTPSNQCSQTSTDEKYIITTKTYNSSGHVILIFCNQYEDDRIWYVYHMSSQEFYTVHRYSRNYDDANLFITLDQWTKFLKMVRLLSTAIVSRLPEDKKDTDVSIMYTHPTNTQRIYSIEKDNDRGIVQVLEQRSSTIFTDSPDIIPFNSELNDAILTYRNRMYTEINKMIYPDLTP